MKHTAIAALLTLAVVAVLAPASHAGKLYQLDVQFRISSPGVPVDVEVKVRDKNGDLEGTSTTTFDGSELLNYTSDDVATIVGVTEDGGDLVVNWVASGYKDKGNFDSESTFEVCLNGTSYSIDQHTSCSQTIDLNVPNPGDPAGTFTYTGGAGECLPGAPGCPSGNKLFAIDGFFSVPVGGCSGGLTVNVRDKNGGIVGTATSAFDGSGAVCDEVVCITGASESGGTLTVDFESHGYKSKGNYDADTTFELIVDGCSTFSSEHHLSCSQPIYLNQPLPNDVGGGSMTWTGGCGACLLHPPVSVEQRAWSRVKGIYKE